MKKTIIAFFALAGMAAAANPTVYTDVKFADNDSTSLTGERSHIIFGNTPDTTPLTLSSWMIEFSITKFEDVGTLLNFTPSAASTAESSGFALRTNGGTKTGIMFINGTSYYGTPDDASSEILLNEASVSTINPLTLRVAYNATSKNAYLYDVTDGEFVSITVNDVKPTLSSVADSHDGSDINDKTQFYCFGSRINYTLGTVTDMSSIAGNKTAFESYIKTKTIPEPTTATLSLLALAGLAARRRRK